VRHEFKTEYVPCIDREPPRLPNIKGDKCSDDLKYCLSESKAWLLARYLEESIMWMQEAWNLCKENEDVGREETGTEREAGD
jgi:hypothetical protein